MGMCMGYMSIWGEESYRRFEGEADMRFCLHHPLQSTCVDNKMVCKDILQPKCTKGKPK